jgi:hypothetical protein
VTRRRSLAQRATTPKSSPHSRLARESSPCIGLCKATYWLVQVYGYEIAATDVWDAYRATLAAAERHGSSAEVKERVRGVIAAEHAGGFVTKV